MVNRYSHIALCYGYTFVIRNHRIDSTSQVQAYYHYHHGALVQVLTFGRRERAPPTGGGRKIDNRITLSLRQNINTATKIKCANVRALSDLFIQATL